MHASRSVECPYGRRVPSRVCLPEREQAIADSCPSTSPRPCLSTRWGNSRRRGASPLLSRPLGPVSSSLASVRRAQCHGRARHAAAAFCCGCCSALRANALREGVPSSVSPLPTRVALHRRTADASAAARPRSRDRGIALGRAEARCGGSPMVPCLDGPPCRPLVSLPVPGRVPTSRSRRPFPSLLCVRDEEEERGKNELETLFWFLM